NLLSSQENLEHSSYAADLKLIQHEWDADNAGLMVDLLKRQISDLGQKHLRHFEWHYWNRLLHGATKVVELEGGARGQVAEFSPDRKLLAGLTKNKKHVVIRLWDTASGKVVKELLGPRRNPPATAQANLLKGQMVFSAKGRYLAAGIGFHRLSGVGGSGKPGFLPKPGGGGGFVTGGGFGSSSPTELWVWDVETG